MPSTTRTEALRWRRHWFVLGLALHYLIAAYNHTLSAFVNYTPPYGCQDQEAQGHRGCFYGNTTGAIVKDACVKGYRFFSLRNDTSIVTEWSLICDDRLYQPMVTTVYFVGVTVGALVTGILADKLGRRPLVIVCLYAHALLGVIISTLAYSFALYIVLRALQGFFVQGLQSCTYTLVLEVIPTQHRTAIGVIAEFYWAGGLMLLSLSSYYIPQWRTLQLVLSACPIITSLVYIWFVPESKIWQQSSNSAKTLKINGSQTKETAERRNDGVQTFEILSPEEKNDVTEAETPPESVSSGQTSNLELKAVGTERQAMFDTLKEGPAELGVNLDVVEDVVLIGREKYVLEVLWLSKGLRKYNIVMVVSWFATMIAYYTITFDVPSLSGDRHVNFFLGALVELAAYASAYVTLSRLGRRLPLSFYQLLGGIICCSVAVVPKDSWAGGTLTTVIALIGKGAVVSSFCCLCLYTSELFPTTVRAAALGHCAFWGRIGSLLAPQLVVLGDYTNRSVPLVVVGLIGICTCFIVLSLPETLGRPLPNTLHDVDNINKALERKSKMAVT